MKMRILAVGALLAAVAMGPGAARGQNFGDLLEKGAKNMMRQQLSPENIERKRAAANNGEAVPVRTPDNWTLVAHRFRPTGPPKPGAMPVILCHGLSYNAQFWNLDPSCSLATYLASKGYDVWVVDLRGCGFSQKWVMKLDDAPSMVVGGLVRRATGGKIAPTGYATIDPKYANWNLDQHIAYDVPTFVNLVRQQTGAPEVAWIGHSMGGIVALGHLARYGNPGIGRLGTVGSQVTMPQGQVAVQLLQEMITSRQQQLAGQLTAQQLAEQGRTSVHNMFFNIQNTSPKVYEALTTYANDVPALGLMQQYMALAKTGELLDARKQFNYAQAMDKITIPVLISCGEEDQLAPPPVQRYLYDHVGSTDKMLVIFGRSTGLSASAGHNDSLVGMNSRDQVYPIIESWLAGARAPRR